MPAKHLSKQDAIDNTDPYKWTFYGQNQPENPNAKNADSFSVGVFRVVPAAAASTKKAEESVIRITGDSAEPELVYDQANYVVDRLNALRNPSPFDFNMAIVSIKQRLLRWSAETEE